MKTLSTFLLSSLISIFSFSQSNHCPEIEFGALWLNSTTAAKSGNLGIYFNLNHWNGLYSKYALGPKLKLRAQYSQSQDQRAGIFDEGRYDYDYREYSLSAGIEYQQKIFKIAYANFGIEAFHFHGKVQGEQIDIYNPDQQYYSTKLNELGLRIPLGLGIEILNFTIGYEIYFSASQTVTQSELRQTSFWYRPTFQCQGATIYIGLRI